MDYLHGRPPKKIYLVSAFTMNSSFKVKILAVNELKAEMIFKNKFPRALINSITYYDEIYK
jgi:hypothetical protein